MLRMIYCLTNLGIFRNLPFALPLCKTGRITENRVVRGQLLIGCCMYVRFAEDFEITSLLLFEY